MLRELAYAKLNLVLHVGPPRDDGMHPICSLFASIDLADELTPRRARPARTAWTAPESRARTSPPGRSPSSARAREANCPPLDVRIEKRIPVAAGLGGGSADAAAALRVANGVAGRPLGAEELRRLAADLGSDVPSQVEPRHALVQGVGERVEPIELPALAAVARAGPEGLSTAAVYAELDRLGRQARPGSTPSRSESSPPRRPAELAAVLENDLQPAALSLRPDLSAKLDSLRGGGRARVPP